MRTCYFCKGPIEQAVIDHMVHGHEGYALLKNVLVEKCLQCGEVYLDAAASQAIDDALRHAPAAREHVEVPVVYT